MKVEDVIKASMSSMRKKKLICIPWWRNKLALTIYKLLPRSISHKIFQWTLH
jgi:short-subunit dehydrogenase